MLRLPTFTYLEPRTLAQALAQKRDAGPAASYVAGGTDLYPNMKRRQQEPRTVISLMRIPELARSAMGEEGAGAGAVVGSCLTLTALGEAPGLRQRYPALVRAAAFVSTPLLRNMGTLGGNLCLDTRCNYYDQTYEWRQAIDFCMKKDGAICWVAPHSPRCWAVSSSDTAPVAVALRAQLKLISAHGERTVDAGDFFRDDGIEYLSRRPDEILASIEMPLYAGWRMTYQKLRRRGSFDFPILGVAAAARLCDGVVEDVRLVLGAVGSSPVDQSELARSLINQRPSFEAVKA
ncbi:MAG TPA: FAD binding domain-containing protein, partial [Gemmatimonadales bacterium]|nr:FAD binding domain-containing protein [Gemmatimonadales bacterium]